MNKRSERTPEADQPEDSDELNRKDLDENFWDQWKSTSSDDIERDTYGSKRRHDLEERFR